jgi:formylglycine-generating enzyme required for sulfatase activity
VSPATGIYAHAARPGAAIVGCVILEFDNFLPPPDAAMYFTHIARYRRSGMADIFISYKSERRAAAEHFAEVLACYGYSVWFDYEAVIGQGFAERIEREIREAKALLVLWCSRSVASRWVREEANLARELGKLVPVKIENCQPPVGSRAARTIDLSAWDGGPCASALDPLIDALEKVTGRDTRLARKALKEYENAWWRLGSPQPRALALKMALSQREAKRFIRKPPPPPLPEPPPPPPPPPAPMPVEKLAEPDWERFHIGESYDAGSIEAYIKQYEASEPQWARKAKKRLAVITAALRGKAKAEHARGARYHAEGRIRVATPITRPAGLHWFLPGAGGTECFKDAEFGPEMVAVPAGEFWMGSKDGEGNADERPRHKVTIAEPFAVGRFAVTFDEWDAARAAGGVTHDPSGQVGGSGRRRPVIDVSWDDAQAYVKWLSFTTVQPYRLLSEAEWEYCCRAGTETQYWWGDEVSREQANYDGNYAWEKGAKDNQKLRPVNSFRPNAWGLYQVHGNVWEWCADCWHGNYRDAPADGSAWTAGDGQYRVARGGSWGGGSDTLRAARRIVNSKDDRFQDVGLRVARTLRP